MRYFKCLQMIAILFVAVSFSMKGQVTPDTAFAVSSNDRTWLNYYTVTNCFDSVDICVDYGEMLVKTSTTKTRVKSKTYSYMDSWYHNPDTIGVQTGITNIAKWDTLTLPANSSVRFYRLAQVKGHVPRTSNNPHGTTTSWTIPDTTILLLEVRDASSDTLLFVADSIRLDPCTKSGYHRFTGTDPHLSYLSKTVPSHAVGKKAYFRLSPRRYGSTTYGMSFANGFCDIAQSLLRVSDTTGISSTDYERLDSTRFSYFMTHMKMYWDAYCFIPDYSGLGFSAAQTDSITNTYWVQDTTIGGIAYYKMKTCASCDSCTVFPKTRVRNNNLESNGVFRPLHPNVKVTSAQYDSEGLDLEYVVSSNPMTIGVYVTDVTGRTIGVGSPNIALEDQLQRVHIELRESAPQQIYVRLVKDDEQTVATFVIAR